MFELNNHIIICGLGATSRYIIEEIEQYKKKGYTSVETQTMLNTWDYIVIESDENK